MAAGTVFRRPSHSTNPFRGPATSKPVAATPTSTPVQTAVPTAPGAFPGSNDEWADYYRSLDPTTRSAWLYSQGSQEQGQNEANQNIEDSASAISSSGRRASERLGQNAANYLDTPAAQALALYSSPDYNAISNDVTASMKASGSRAIQKANADAMGAAVNRVTRQGLDGGAIAAQLQAAAGFRASADQAFINAETDRWQSETNLAVRERATLEMSKRDAVYADMQSAAVAAEASGDTLAAQIRARKTFFQPDWTEPLLAKHVSDLEELDRLAQDKSQQIIDLTRDMWEEEKKNYATEKEALDAEREMNTMLDLISMGIDITGLLISSFPFVGPFIEGILGK